MEIQWKDEKRQIESQRTVQEVFAEEIENSQIIIIAAKCNNEYVPLNYVIKKDSIIELIDITDKEGMRIYRRGLLYVMEKAFTSVYKEAVITVHYQLTNALYCEALKLELTEKIIDQVNQKMQEIIEQDLEIKKIQMTKEEAKKFYEENPTNKGKLQIHAKEKEFVSLYYCEDYFNYFFGVMPISTGYMKYFKLEKKENGFIIRYPDKKNPNEIGEYIDNHKLFKALEEYQELHRDLRIHTVYRLNEAVQQGKIRDVILLDEALHEKKIAEIANKIAENKEVKMVLIAGPSSSGKTTFAQRLRLQLKINGLKPVTISVDNYFMEREETPKDEDGNYNFEAIEAIDLKLFNEHISKLLNGEQIEIPTFDFIEGKKKYTGKNLKLEQDEILIIEGIHCLNDKLTNSIPRSKKYKVYISALAVLNVDYYNRISTTDTRLIRRMVRDYKFRGYSAIHTLEMWESVGKGEKKYIFPFQEEADMMFNTSLIYELGVLKSYAIPLLKEIGKQEEQYPEAMRLYDFLRYFDDIPDEDVPKNSLLREFIGGGVFEH